MVKIPRTRFFPLLAYVRGWATVVGGKCLTAFVRGYVSRGNCSGVNVLPSEKMKSLTTVTQQTNFYARNQLRTALKAL